MSSISCLVAQLAVMLDKSMPVFFSRPFFLSRTFSLTLNQMHVVVFSESVFHLVNLLYPPDISLSAFMCFILSVGPRLVPMTFTHKSKSKNSADPPLPEGPSLSSDAHSRMLQAASHCSLLSFASSGNSLELQLLHMPLL